MFFSLGLVWCVWFSLFPGCSEVLFLWSGLSCGKHEGVSYNVEFLECVWPASLQCCSVQLCDTLWLCDTCLCWCSARHSLRFFFSVSDWPYQIAGKGILLQVSCSGRTLGTKLWEQVERHILFLISQALALSEGFPGAQMSDSLIGFMWMGMCQFAHLPRVAGAESDIYF